MNINKILFKNISSIFLNYMDILVSKSKPIKICAMVLASVFIIICYELDVGAYRNNSKLASIYLTYSGKERYEILDSKSISSLGDCNGDYFC